MRKVLAIWRLLLTDYFNENCQILLLEKGLLDRENIIFTYQKYDPSFLYYGYTTQNFKFEFGRIAELEIVYSVHANPSARTSCTSLTEDENHPHGDCTILN